MTPVKKYIHFLLMIGLCLHSAHMVASDIPVPSLGFEVPSQSGEALRDSIFSFSKNISGNSKLVLIPIAAGCLLFMASRLDMNGLSTRSEACQGMLIKRLSDKCARAVGSIGKKISFCIDNIPMSGPVRAGLKTILEYVLSGITNYVPNNKKFVSAALLLHVAGRVLEQQTFCNMASGGSLVLGWVRGMLDKYDEENEKRHQENILKHVETQRQISEVANDIRNVSQQIDTTKTELTGQIKSLGGQLGTKIETVGEKVEKLSKDLHNVPEQLMKLIDQINAIDVKEGERDKRIEVLFKRLEKANEKYLDAQESLGIFSQQLMDQVVALKKETTEQLSSIQSKADSRDEKIDELLKKEVENNRILEYLQKAHQENNQQVIDLRKKIDKNDKAKLEFLEKITSLHESNALEFTKKISGFELVQNNMQSALNAVLSEVKQVKKEVSALASQVDVITVSNQEVVKEVSALRGEVTRLQEDLKNQANQFQIAMLQSQLAYTENTNKLRKELGAAAKTLEVRIIETQEMVQQRNFDESSVFILPKQSNFHQKELRNLLGSNKRFSSGLLMTSCFSRQYTSEQLAGLLQSKNNSESLPALPGGGIPE